MRALALLLTLTGCYAGDDIYITAGGDGYGAYSTGITVEAYWNVPWDAEEGWFDYYIDDLCRGCSGSFDWFYYDNIDSVELLVYDAPYSGEFILAGWYFDGWDWWNICDDPPAVYIDGYYWQPEYIEYYDGPYLVDCELWYGYSY